MDPIPSGTVTFLFTDIEGSTRRWEDTPDAMAAALERHDALLRAAVRAHGGTVFKTVGDAVCAAFATAGSGLAAAVEAQRALAAEDWSAFGEGFAPLLVRMGLHTGEARERGGDYFGPPVNRVARLEAAGHGGQVLLSGATYNLVRDDLAEGLSLFDWGEHRLRDLRHGEHIFQLRGPGLPSVDRAPVTAARVGPRDRVRVVASPFAAAGGDAPSALSELETRLETALRSDDAPIVTLTETEAQRLARRKPADWRGWRLGRVAEWSQPRYRLDGRFVGLSLLVDQGETAVQGRWQAAQERYEDLGALLAGIPDPAVVVLGPPGGGKSTLLRRLELDTAIAGLRGEDPARATFFVSLNTYGSAEPGLPAPAPARWLAERWASRFPDLPELADLLAEGRVTLLLDALNEMPSEGAADARARARRWKDWLVRLAAEQPGNRVVFSCRSLDYSQSLSTPELRVPQVRIEPLTDAQVRDFLQVYSPSRWREIWAALDGSPKLEVLRSPYFLALLVEQVESTGEVPEGRAALFTGFVRQALRREVERDSPVFASEALLTRRDRRQVARWRWSGAFDLPERGLLVPRLAFLAQAMQRERREAERSQVRIDLDDALDLLDTEEDEAIVVAGEALAVLDEDEAAGELMFVHQLVQEYFAARELAKAPEPELVRSAWRASEIRPTVEQVVAGLDPADPLPGLPQTGWEETTLLAAAMAGDPEGFLRDLMDVNLALAGRAAAQPDLAPRLSGRLLDELRWALVARSRDPEADLRDRIACGHALGDLGDPRFERGEGPDGAFLLPPLATIPGGAYPLGDEEPLSWAGGTTRAHAPRHTVSLTGFRIGRFPVTNAEWRCFQDADGYDDERWWDTEASRAWRRGEGTMAATHTNVRAWLAKLRAEPELAERFVSRGAWSEEVHARWRRRLAMSEDELEAHLHELYPETRLTEPRYWRMEQYSHPVLPVLGICWYEARAYLCWLSAQSGHAFRLPTEAEWEAAARGAEGRRFAYGDRFDPARANVSESHLRVPVPVGVFPSGDTPEGVSDMTGTCWEWCASAFGRDPSTPERPYPYDPADGREEPDTPSEVQRVSRGGGWHSVGPFATAFNRSVDPPATRNSGLGMRVATS